MYKGEWFNSISHLIGAVAALVGLVIVVVVAAQQGDPWKIVSFSVYGFTLFSLYTISTLYHSLQGRAKRFFRKLDHMSIYFLIAGTYTPFTLVTLRGVWGWTIFGIIWGLALFGLVLEALPQKGNRVLSMVVYVLMGWLVLVALKPLLAALPTAGFIWLLVGGICYTGGMAFFFFDEKVRHFHGIWHLFVLAGSVCHYLTILFYVA
ncbi:MAG: hemolysin III family protein [Candidatus Contendobacter sp.]|jgi:hemolysin III|nr:hemolysin III family protein [Gammaproteobacteria bacterium]MCC8993774.1 hemolysin III family protein [Candidatus Contendobacter sp.]